ncbi:sensor histidine kinase [Bosea sp. UC22_33]|uniref:sensor histidine kinase n=1 Tax=Bosea sp. UC22_33 TaxID=3350165 RepID=UPI003672345F
MTLGLPRDKLKSALMKRQAASRIRSKFSSLNTNLLRSKRLFNSFAMLYHILYKLNGELNTPFPDSVDDLIDQFYFLSLDNKEIQHRLDNFVPLVLSIIKLTAESSTTVAELCDALEGRLRAIANADVSTRKGVDHCSLEELVRLELSPYCRSNQFDLIGPSVGLRSGLAQSFSIIIHELTTNAVKYGALSCPEGKVLVRWSIQPIDSTHASLCLQWLERNGPQATGSCKRGFGTSILCDDGKAITGGTSTLGLSPEGLEYVLTTALDL